ncbi:MAG: hypothetical protein ABJL55_11220 [Roseibium sp.]
MLNVYAQSFLEASRFSPNTRPDLRTQTLLCQLETVKAPAQPFWKRFVTKR